MRRHTLAAAVLCGVTFVAVVSGAEAGSAGSVASALGGAYSMRASGPEAALWNPATLALPEHPSFALTLGSVSANAATNGLSLGLYNKVNGQFLDDALKQDVLAAIPTDGLRLDADGEGQALGFSIGSFALTSHVAGFGNAALPKDLADLALYGNALDRTYSFDGTDGNGLAYGGVVAAYALRLPAGKSMKALSLGASFEDILIAKHATVMHATGAIATTSSAFLGNGVIDARVGETGKGYTASIGLAGETLKGTRFGVSVSGFGSLHFTEGTDYHNTVSATTVTLDDASGADFVTSQSDSTPSPEYDVQLPTTVRGGVSRRLGPLAVSADLAYVVRSSVGVRTGSDIAVGAELWPAGILRLRGGYGHAGATGTRLSGGIGLAPGPMRLDLAAVHYGGTSSASTRGVGVGASFGFEF